MLSRSALRLILALGLLLFGGGVFAHATLVLGTLQSEPGVPRAGEPFTLTLELTDPTQVPVEDAWILAEFRTQGASEDAEPISARFEETETAGVYQTQVTLPERATYSLSLRDQTFRQEEARATLTFDMRDATNPEELDFVFPPTATGQQSLSTWLLWLLGLPLVAALVVTVLVLTDNRDNEAVDGAAKAQGESP